MRVNKIVHILCTSDFKLYIQNFLEIVKICVTIDVRTVLTLTQGAF